MKILDTLRKKAKKLKREISALYYAYQDKELKFFPKMVIIFTLGYALSPIDLIPDFIPVLGYLDDLIIIPALLALSIRLIPKEIMGRARDKSEKEPICLKKNWVFGIIFISVWIILLTVLLLAIIKFIRGNA